MGTHGCIAASSPVSAISVGALRELLAAFGEIRCAIEQSDEGKSRTSSLASSDPGAGLIVMSPGTVGAGSILH
jgi:hypothetical protein